MNPFDLCLDWAILSTRLNRTISQDFDFDVVNCLIHSKITTIKLKLSTLLILRNYKTVQLFQANLYSLTLRHEEPHVLVLSKTGKTVKVDEFLVPRAPVAKQPVEVKRRKRTPPPTSADNLIEQVHCASSF